MNPYAAHLLGPSSRPARHKVLISWDGENEVHRKAHHPSNLVYYDNLELLFHILNWLECNESQAPPSLFLVVKLGIRNLIPPRNQNRLIPSIEV